MAFKFLECNSTLFQNVVPRVATRFLIRQIFLAWLKFDLEISYRPLANFLHTEAFNLLKKSLNYFYNFSFIKILEIYECTTYVPPSLQSPLRVYQLCYLPTFKLVNYPLHSYKF